MEAISDAEAREFLRDAKVAHMGVIDSGAPYVTPMSFVVDDDRILFRTKPGRRFEALMANPTVSIEASSFDEETGDWVSVIVTGTAVEQTDEPTISRAVELLMSKYSESIGDPLTRGGSQPMATFPHVVAVEIDDISGMCSGRGFTPRTRPGRL